MVEMVSSLTIRRATGQHSRIIWIAAFRLYRWWENQM